MKLHPADERFLNNEAFLRWFSSERKAALTSSQANQLKQQLLRLLDKLADFFFITPIHVDTIQQELADFYQLTDLIKNEMNEIQKGIPEVLKPIFEHEDLFFTEDSERVKGHTTPMSEITVCVIIYQNWIEGYLYWILMTQKMVQEA